MFFSRTEQNKSQLSLRILCFGLSTNYRLGNVKTHVRTDYELDIDEWTSTLQRSRSSYHVGFVPMLCIQEYVIADNDISFCWRSCKLLVTLDRFCCKGHSLMNHCPRDKFELLQVIVIPLPLVLLVKKYKIRKDWLHCAFRLAMFHRKT